MLAAAGTADPIRNTLNPRRNPLVDLPFDESRLVELLSTLDGIIVTHLHNDHWDAAARTMLPKSLPLFCQPEDQQRIEEAGFKAVYPVQDVFDWQGIHIIRTGGQHGRGEIGELMAPVSGFVLRSSGEPTVYIAGDTIWCGEVKQAIDLYQPEVIIVNSGAAEFKSGGPITMAVDDVIAVCNAADDASIIAVHMEAINHCLLSRRNLSDTLTASGLICQVRVPEDGEMIEIDLQ
jgi:L-ascorbate metabolism protein UlaG (beta-lactamase superfamily)